MTNPYPRNSRSATLYEAGWNAARFVGATAQCPYTQDYAVRLWHAGFAAGMRARKA